MKPFYTVKEKIEFFLVENEINSIYLTPLDIKILTLLSLGKLPLF